MKYHFVLGMIAILASFVVAQSDIAGEASSAYQNSDYDTAIMLYETLVAQGVNDGVVFYNLGSAYYESGDNSRALLNYRRAQNLIPRDLDLSAAMAFIRAQRLDLQGDETGLLESLSVLTSGVLTLTELGWIGFVVWTLWFGLLCVAILRNRWRDALRVPLILLGIVVLVSLLLLGSRLYITATAPAAVVVPSTVQVMSGPGEQYLEIFELHEVAELRVLETKDDWVRFVLPDGRQGWIPRQAVELV
jgi:tetratricopeptide (TPR) repeat protein